ncbi:MAG: GNAT family N-acetyltransferase [Allisonella histaminiformans]|uniref:GNAT family N-acetyltransferase n=1 Tax=Allisonella histaminiformans TaxID=209880 RepID=UPI002A81F7D4|nr:GNAT family N-acetyltransferase [Allisonella histaminiformans]MDY3957831.1 GNAT family N-acetyltransferase [Allisonella histaminiformans]
MQFRRATEADRKSIEALWAYCFEKPDDPFFQWYFSQVCQMDDVVVAEENQHIAADLHLRPYTLNLRGNSMPVDYMVGVATHPAARGRGIASKLLKNAFRISRSRGKSAVILMPSDASFYMPLGCSFYVQQWERSAAPEWLARIGEKPEKAMTVSSPDEWHILASVYEKFTEKRNGFTQRDEKTWRTFIEGQLNEGYIAVTGDETGPTGYLCYGIDGRRLIANEMAYASDRGRRGLYAFMAGHRGSIDRCTWYEPLDDCSFYYWPNGAEHTYIENRTFPFMMARITDPVGVIDGLPCEKQIHGEYSFQLVDPVLSENNGIYMVRAEDGEIHALQDDIFYKLRLHIEDTSGIDLGNHIPEPSFCMNVNTLAELVFGTSDFDELIKRNQITWLTKDEAVKEKISRFMMGILPEKDNWIAEWY